MEQFLMDKWVEIDVDAVKQNLLAVRSLVDEKTRLIAVIKANAYGHGAIETARILYQNGVEFFAVSFFSEALELRKAGIRSNILVFSPIVLEHELKEAISQHLTISITALSDWKMLEHVGYISKTDIRVHLKLDTGLGRFGLTSEETVTIVQEISLYENIRVEGIYTHMADAASNSAYTQKQFTSFMETVNLLEAQGFSIPVRHCANSAAFLKYPHMHLDGVRIGTLLAGHFPAGISESRIKVKDPFTFKSRIISLRQMEKGSYLGYYRSYRLKKPAQIAVLPVGFSDGLNLEVANKAGGFLDLLKAMIRPLLVYFNIPRFSLHVSIHGVNYPVRAKVFMQMALVEIPPGVEVQIGDEVEIPIRKTLASRNLSRVYVQGGKAAKISREEGTSYVVDEL